MEAHQTSNLGVLGSSPRQDVRKIFFSEKKEKKKKDNKGIKLIKTFIKDMYFKFGKTNNKIDE